MEQVVKKVTLSVEEPVEHRKVSKSRLHKHRKPKKSRQVKYVEIQPQRTVLWICDLEEVANGLKQTAKSLVRPGYGILAADDTLHQINTKLEELKLYPSNLNRFKFHELYLGKAIHVEDYISAVLLRLETITNDVLRGKKLVHMIWAHEIKLGVRLDEGVVSIAGTDGEFASKGLDNLEMKLRMAKDFGAEFTMWRCVYKISDFNPSRLAIRENSQTLARYAVMSQRMGLLPIVAVDVLPYGSHDEMLAQASLKEILTSLVKTLTEHRAMLEGMLVRVTATSPGLCYQGPQNLARVAACTARALSQCLPPALGGVLMCREETFCRSLEILNEMQNCPLKKPFFVSHCFSRVILNDVVSAWAGQDKRLAEARNMLMKKLKCCSLATFGQCSTKHKTMFITPQFDL